MKDRRAGDNGVRPGVANLPGILTGQPAIDFDHRIKPALLAQNAQSADLRQHFGQETLPAKSGIDGHDQHHAAQRQYVFDLRQRGGRVQHDAGELAEIVDPRQGAVQMDRRAGLAMHQQMVGAGGGEILEIALGLDHHQMHIERPLRHPAHRRDDERADRQVRHEASIHHVDMDPVGAGRLDGPYLFAKAAEIGREDRRADDQRARHRSPAERPPLPAAAPQQELGSLRTGAAGIIEFERHAFVLAP